MLLIGTAMSRNIDHDVVTDFGDEWVRFDQSTVSDQELRKIFESYFRVFPWESLPSNAIGADIGCGTGRWAKFVAPKVGTLHCVEPSRAITVAERILSSFSNVQLHSVDIDSLPFEEENLDFFYSLGVLHHVPDTGQALSTCVSRLKPGGVALIYLYYKFDNRPDWFAALWGLSDSLRRVVSVLPPLAKHRFADLAALALYFPLARSAFLAELVGVNVEHFPLSSYRDKSFYSMRTDALDRFGTRLEQRFTQKEITAMMLASGLNDIRFSDDSPFWCAVGTKTG